MNGAGFQSDQLMFGELLAYLRQHGFRLGVDHYLRLQQLLERINGRCAPHELRTLLCPIFATSKTQQEQFYRAFDSYFDFFQVAEETAETELVSTEDEPSVPLALKAKAARRRWLYAACAATLAALVIIAFVLFRPKPAEQSATDQASMNAAPDAARSPAPSATGETTTEIVGTQAPVEVEEPATATQTPAPIPESSFYERYRTSIHLAIILSPLLIFLLYEWYRFARRKLLLQKQQARKPPFVWPVRVDAPVDGVYDSEQFLTAARLMRRRQVDEFRRLDVEATVTATIERLGFPDFRYKSDSRVPEYLVLIDRASFRDHQARLFDELTQTLEREGVFVVRYFFDGDPRVCRDEVGAGVMQLAELQNRFGGHRLLIFGDGEKLLDPIRGRLDGWTAIFNHWQDRAILTVESPARWGLREIALAQSFIVLPATLDGLLALVDHFETTVAADLRSWARGGFETPLTEATPEETIAALRRTLGEETFQWLAACAVYTELQWNLTLYIGSLPAMPPGLLTEANLLKLIRLSWFRTGAIPDELRWLLINELAPERQRAVRAAIIELLEKDPAPPETFASDQYRLNLFAQRWLESRTRKRLGELLEVMKRLPRSQVVRDLTLIRFLESARRSPLDFLLPDRLRKLFYHRGIPAFGLKTGARFLVTLLFIGLAWVGIRALAPRASDRTLLARDSVSPMDALPEQIPASSPTAEPTPESAPSDDDQDSPSQPETQRPEQQPSASPQFETLPPVTEGSSAPTPAVSGTSQTVVSPSTVPPVGDQGAATVETKATGDNDKTRQVPPAPVPSPTTGAGGATASETPSQPVPTPMPPPRVVAGGTLNGKAISLPKPVYPPEAVEARASGKVVVDVMLDEFGKVISAKAIKGHPLLHQAAVKAAFQARFPQTFVSGQPVKVTGVLNYNFEIKEPSGPDRRPQGDPGRRPPARPGGRPPRE